jgi:hypothetical protein
MIKHYTLGFDECNIGDGLIAIYINGMMDLSFVNLAIFLRELNSMGCQHSNH